MATGTIPKYADGNDTGWVPLTLDSAFSAGVLKYRRIGQFVEVRGSGLKLSSDSTASYVRPGRIDASIYPSENVTVSGGYDQYSCYCTINSNGYIYFRRPADVASITTSDELRFAGMYMLG